jgi:adenosylcobinamide hydrolase
MSTGGNGWMKKTELKMKKASVKLKEKTVPLTLKGIEAKVVYHIYDGFDLNTLLVSLGGKRRVLSTWDGYREVKFVANNYTPLLLSERTMKAREPIKSYERFRKKFSLALGIRPDELAFLSTGVDMDDLAVHEGSYQELKVCCLATAGAKGNALRSGVDKAICVERRGNFELMGTINVIVLTNAALTDGAMARAIITATEAKTAALQDLNVRSTSAPQNQATGTGTDNVIVVSGKKIRAPLRVTSGHTKIGELIGFSTKTAVTEALKKHDGFT